MEVLSPNFSISCRIIRTQSTRRARLDAVTGVHNHFNLGMKVTVLEVPQKRQPRGESSGATISAGIFEDF